MIPHNETEVVDILAILQVVGQPYTGGNYECWPHSVVSDDVLNVEQEESAQSEPIGEAPAGKYGGALHEAGVALVEMLKD